MFYMFHDLFTLALRGLIYLAVIVGVAVYVYRKRQGYGFSHKNQYGFGSNYVDNTKVVTEDAMVTGMRREVDGEDMRYFVKFTLSGGHEQEMEVPGEDFFLMNDGDRGQLVHQGTGYITFKKKKSRGASSPPVSYRQPNRSRYRCAYDGSYVSMSRTMEAKAATAVFFLIGSMDAVSAGIVKTRSLGRAFL